MGGRTAARSVGDGVRRDCTAHRLLRVACALPLTRAELTERMDERFGTDAASLKTIRMALSELRRAGFLHAPPRPGELMLYSLTPEGEAQLDRMALTPNRLRILSVACGEPLSASELLGAAEQRGGPLVMTREAVGNLCNVLTAHGLLHLARRGLPGGKPHTPSLYTLTPQGESVLDALYAGAL